MIEVIQGDIMTLAVDAIASAANSTERYVSMQAEARVSRAGLAILRYAAREGSFPERLDLVGESNLADPFTGKPLHYRQTASGFTVYSTGSNMKDDGGTADEDPESGDIVWHYSRAPQAEVER